MTKPLGNSGRKLRRALLGLILLLLCVAELISLAVSLGLIQNRAYVSSAIIALHRFQTNPTAETELAWCKEREHLSEVERQFERVFTVLLVFNTAAVVICWQRFWRRPLQVESSGRD
jgi:hypothetical protein